VARLRLLCGLKKIFKIYFISISGCW